MATPTYTAPTAVPADEVERVNPVSIGMHGLATNRDYVADDAAGKVAASELLLSTTSRLGVWRGYDMLASPPQYHGDVAEEAAMLALHNWDADPHETVLYTYVLPGDWCTRSDDPGYYWVCVAGHGTAIEHWQRRPLGDTVAQLRVDLDALNPTDIGRAIMSLPTPSAEKIVRLNTDGTVSAIDVPSGGGAGAEVLITEYALTSEAASVTFSSIPQTYRHLRVVVAGGWSATPNWITIRCNGDTAANYDWSTLRFTAGSVYPGAAAGASALVVGDIPNSATVGGLIDGTLYGYRAGWHKQWRGVSAACFGDATSNHHPREMWGRWRSTAAVTSLTVASDVAGNFRVGTTISLYGIS